MQIKKRMATGKGKAITLLFLLAVLASACFGVALPKASAADVFAGWSTSGWTISEEGGVAVLLGNSSASLNVLSSDEKVNADGISFDVYIDSVSGNADGNIGAAYRCTSGYQYFFEYNAISKTAKIRRIGENGTDVTVSDVVSCSLAEKKWYSMRITFAKDDLKWYLNGKEILSASNTYDDTFSMGSCYIQGYFVCPKLKNVKIERAEGSALNDKEFDFEFTSPESVTPFAAENGEVSYEDGCLKYTLNGDNGALISPKLYVACGNRYSARISIRNTVFVRMKNATSASGMKVYFKTNETDEFTEELSRTFDIVANDAGFTSYYFNLSALTDSNGYITELKFIPVGAENGEIYIDAITFEREKEFYDYAGTIESCVADESVVTIRGTLNDRYAGKSVKIYEIYPENYTESTDGLTPVARVRSNGKTFTATLPFRKGNMTRLSSLFLAVVSGEDGNVKIADRFSIENYRDFTENPYEFTLPSLTVDVTSPEFGAKGDAFTNDNAAIQKAVDYVSSQGGGKVIVPGDDSYYGRRYIATNIKMKNNVELHIEKGAVIWQSPRTEDYDYDVAIGHDVYIPGVNWTTACSCHNLPLIQGDSVKNVKITGEGTLRCVDTGGDNLDTLSGISIWRGCTGRIHIIPIGFWNCENVEIRDITLRRTNNYHINMRTCKNIYIANVTLREVTCAGGDGFSATVGTKNMILDRCFCFINDDAVTICSTYNDPRGQVSPWWSPNPGGDNCIDNLVVKHCNFYGGHGITFITWGTDAPNLSMQEIKNVEVYDCALNGTAGSVGSWADNPYYGGVYDGSEVDDYSPVKQICIHDNEYRGKATIDSIKATDFISDCGIRSTGDFRNGTFDREDGKGGWISGFSNWSYAGDNAKFSVVRGDDGYAGKIAGNGKLWQGLYLGTGEHTFSVDVNVLSGKAKLFAADAVTGEIVAEKIAEQNGRNTLTFSLTTGKTLYIGVEQTENGEVIIDNASVGGEEPVYARYFDETFETLDEVTFDYSSWELTEASGNRYISMLSGGGTGFTDFGYDYASADLRFNVRVTNVVSTLDGNVSIAFARKDSNTQYYLEYNTVGKYARIRKFDNGASTVLQTVSLALEKNVWYTFGLRFGNGGYEFYVDGDKILSGTDESPLDAGKLMIVTYNTAIDLDNVTLGEYQTVNVNEKTSVVPVKKKYVLSFDVAGGDVQPAAQELAEGGKPADLPTPAKKGYVFEGWTTDDGEIYDPSSFVMPARNVKVTAVWRKAADESGESEDSSQSDTSSVDSSESAGSGCKSGMSGFAGLFVLAAAGVVLAQRRKRNER